MIRLRRPRPVDDPERGSGSIEAAIVVPALGAFIVLLIFAGRVAVAHQSLQSAAAEGARAASMERTGDAAVQRAQDVVAATLANQGLRCSSTSVEVDADGFTAPVGTPASVTVTVTCHVDLTDLMVPLPGNRTITAAVTSPIDQWRQR
ncbi:TadE family protein [Xylanimonas cellulosilytica DSM 15894]|uniref:TadE family protein n=1 Tax=Xylanimonas cellulosilytica (strain DSM 15894 / JCM 12276 / CECT 5975 / KCTC 9989 / LMG 20990 / NBRC 107835 / XIL07) TaxID=446471 RepID=D1BY28_XYLCX|nr:TadE family protein [Xylanimonas cellulosilytica]ACZ29871.1 TadE family protein [Xylanimonas cellulosilytica DSM 15894]